MPIRLRSASVALPDAKDQSAAMNFSIGPLPQDRAQHGHAVRALSCGDRIKHLDQIARNFAAQFDQSVVGRGHQAALVESDDAE